jgi:uncharacterized protein (DUF433 family)
MADTPYVTRTPAGDWRVTGTRVSLDSVVHAYWQGRLPEAIVADFPSLTLELVHGALAYYLGHRAEVDAYLAEQDTRWHQFQQDSAAKHGPLLWRVRHSADRPCQGHPAGVPASAGARTA